MTNTTSDINLSGLPEELYGRLSENESENESDYEDVDEDEGPTTPRAPDHAEPLLPSSGPVRSSPIRGTPGEMRLARIRKSRKRRKKTFEQNRLEKEKEDQVARHSALNEVLDDLHSKNLKLWDLLEYIFNPEHQQGNIRHNDFFIVKGRSKQILNWWLSPKNRSETAKAEVRGWVEDYAAQQASREARSVTESKKLQTMSLNMDAETVRNFDLAKVNQNLYDYSSGAPFTMRILRSFSTSRHVKKHTEYRKTKTEMVITSAALTCLGEYSHSNNLFKRMLSLYLYACGAQRQSITVLSTLGLCESYTNLMSKNIRRKRKTKKSHTHTDPLIVPSSDDNPFLDASTATETATPSATEVQVQPERTGTLYQLSDSMRRRARKLASTGLYAEDYDNININFKNAEQIIGRHDSQENGTCATIYPLLDAKIEDLNLKTYQEAYLAAPPLKLQDIVLLGDEQKQFKKNLIHTILRIIVKHGGPGFERFRKPLQDEQWISPDQIPVHQTDLHPLPTWPIDESTIVGNAEVDEAVRTELELNEDKIPGVSDRVRFVGGDQLSIARLRALEFIRAGQEEGYNGYFWGVWIPGLFHAKIADAHGTLLNHLGKPDAGAQNPGSLAFHNARLDRLPITATSLPTFRTCRDLIFVSLYARVLHCLLLVSNCDSLEEYLLKVTDWSVLVEHAQKIWDQFANTARVEELRSQRAEELKEAPEGAKPTKGDAVFENACLFLRDALISREFNDAVKCGDSGRVVLVLKTWALSFRGNGRTKYAYEMFHLIHNLTSVWTPEIRNIVLKNWLLNPSGLPNRFVEMDLVQEHLNFKIKVAYKARGSNASWDWLETVSPCVVGLSDLQKAFNDKLGGNQGTDHAEVDLTADIRSLMDSLKEYRVYSELLGRFLSNEEIAKEVVGLGLSNVTAGPSNPLSDYNGNGEKLQKRRRMNPVTVNPESEADSPTPSHSGATPRRAQPTPKSTGTTVQEPSPIPGIVEVADDDEVTENGDKTELEVILEDLEEGKDEPTLTRETEEDVAYDMDEVEVEVSDEESDSSSESGDESGGEWD